MIFLRLLYIIVFIFLVLLAPIEVLFYIFRWIVTGKQFPDDLIFISYIDNNL